MAKLAPGSIELNNVTKSFKLARSKGYSTLKSFALGKKQSSTKQETPEGSKKGNKKVVLEDLNLSIPAGSSLALVGRNGSGKSTILKLIAGIYTPDKGSVEVSGSLSALIELGAGFHPDFTGRENIYLGGVMFGLSKKQIEERFKDIVKYSELEEVIDEPVRTYSSGMYMRLGFSLAIHTDPDILLIDEVLAVGDAHFISKCHDSISEFKRKGKTLIFVTHDLSSVSRWCDKAIWLDQGRIRLAGKPRDIADAYLSNVAEKENEDADFLSGENNETRIRGLELSKLAPDTDIRALGKNSLQRWGNGSVKITNVELLGIDGSNKKVFFEDESMMLKISYKIEGEINDLVFGFGIIRSDGFEIFGTNSSFDPELDQKISLLGTSSIKEGEIKIDIPRLGLSEDSYYLDVATHAHSGLPYDYHHRLHKFQIRNKTKFSGLIAPELKWGL